LRPNIEFGQKPQGHEKAEEGKEGDEGI